MKKKKREIKEAKRVVPRRHDVRVPDRKAVRAVVPPARRKVDSPPVVAPKPVADLTYSDPTMKIVEQTARTIRIKYDGGVPLVDGSLRGEICITMMGRMA